MTVVKAFSVKTMKKELKSPNFWRDVTAEFLATFMLMSVQSALPLSFGKGELPGGPAVKVGLGMGFIVATMAWSLGDFGGGHLNPAVSIAMLVRGYITILRGVAYVIAQCVGAIAGAGFIYAVTPAQFRDSLAATNLGPDVKAWQGFLVEAWVTCILVMTIFGATNTKRKGNVFMPTIIIGFAVALGIMAAFNHTGGSLNPARSLGPAVVLNLWDNHWVYWVGPVTGGILAAIFYGYILDRVDGKCVNRDAGIDNEGADFGEEKM